MNSNAPADALADYLAKLTTEPGIYRMFDKDGVVLYVGKAINLKKRVSSYFNKQNIGIKTRALVEQIHTIEVTVTRSETEALILESNLIKTLKPKYNILMRDDKSYPYIHISDHPEYPRIEGYRSKKKPTSGDYFGPYPSGTAVRETLLTIQKIFKIRNCRDSYFNARSRPCLQYQIKRCTAPCVKYISPEDYQKSIIDARRFLQGKSQAIIDGLVQRMETAVAHLRYEEAAVLRDQIKSLRAVQEQQGMVLLRGDADVVVLEAYPGFACVVCVSVRQGQVLASRSFFPHLPAQAWPQDEDELWTRVFDAFIGFYYLENPERIPPMIYTDRTMPEAEVLAKALSLRRGSGCKIQANPRGDKARWLDFAKANLAKSITEHQNKKTTITSRFKALQDVLGLSNPIRRMECFDISHTQGASTIASCVVFNEQGPANKDYRRFNIEGITPGDDYAAMEQAITRRFKRLKELQSLPDVLIIDGGIGQVAVAKKVLADLDIHEVLLLGVAKGPSRKAGWEKLILVDAAREFILPEDSNALHLLQHIRDEAHRFAITAHRKKRQKVSLESSLESIEGVGAKRRQALLHRFGGLRELARVPAEEIAKVPGISKALAERIYNHFH